MADQISREKHQAATIFQTNPTFHFPSFPIGRIELAIAIGITA